MLKMQYMQEMDMIMMVIDYVLSFQEVVAPVIIFAVAVEQETVEGVVEVKWVTLEDVAHLLGDLNTESLLLVYLLLVVGKI